MSEHTPYTLAEAQALVDEVFQRDQARRDYYAACERMVRHGDARTGSAGDTEWSLNTHRQLVNIIHPFLELQHSAMLDRDPQHLVRPQRPEEGASRRAQAWQRVLRFQWDTSEVYGELEKAVKDYQQLGTGVTKTVWDTQVDEVTKDDEEFTEELADLVEAEMDERGLGDDEELDDDTVAELAESVSTRRTEDLYTGPVAQWVHPADVIVDPEASEPRECRWMAQRLVLPRAEVEANPAFEGADDLALAVQREETDAVDQATDTNDEVVEIFEFYDLASHRLLVFQRGAAAELFDDEVPWGHRFPPFQIIHNYRASRNAFWGYGEVALVAGMLSIYQDFNEETLRQAMEAGPMVFIRDDVLDQHNQAAIHGGAANSVVRVKSDGPFNELMHVVDRAGVNQHQLAALDRIEDLIRKVMGINDFQAGGTGTSRMSATAVAHVGDVASERLQTKIGDVEDLSRQVARVYLRLTQELADREMLISIAGDPESEWEVVDPDDLRGQFDVRVESGSTRAINKATEAQRGMQTIREVVPTIGQLGYDPEPLVRQALKQMEYPQHIIDELIASRQDPQADQGGQGGGEQPGAAGAPAGGGAAGGEAADALAQLLGGEGGGQGPAAMPGRAHSTEVAGAPAEAEVSGRGL